MIYVNLERSIEIVNHVFFGYKVMIGNTNSNRFCPSSLIKNAIKYMSLDNHSRDIWDDPTMLPAHKYQNIPQVDISNYEDDYCINGFQYRPIQINNDVVTITYVYSANKEFHQINFEKSDSLFQKLIHMTHIDRLSDYLDKVGDVPISYELHLMIFGGNDLTDMLSNEIPSYDITIQSLYDTFQKSPHNLYVPYRRGWSRVLNIIPINPSSDMAKLSLINGNGDEKVHLLGMSAITTWDGASTKIESHGVEVEDMRVGKVYDADSMEFKMRRMSGTHEYIDDVELSPSTDIPSQYYAISTIKGINVNEYEFNMP